MHRLVLINTNPYTKLEVFSFIHCKDRTGVQNLKMGHTTLEWLSYVR